VLIAGTVALELAAKALSVSSAWGYNCWLSSPTVLIAGDPVAAARMPPLSNLRESRSTRGADDIIRDCNPGAPAYAHEHFRNRVMIPCCD